MSDQTENATPTIAPPPPTRADAVQALEELVSSTGWAIFVAHAQQHAGAESIANDLAAAAIKTTDMGTLGALTAARLASAQTVRFLLNLPGELISQLTARRPL